VAVPRHDRATEALQREALAAGVGVASARPGGDVWLWDDRPGVLARYYAAADVAVVCGSLRPYGGHNPMEPAACGAAVVIGPHHSSQQDAVAALRAGGAASVLEGAGDLGPALAVLLADRAVREDRARRALAVVASLRGTAARTAAELARMGLWRA
jgi:3-deoxy-D-manno-octulosonic-acid transferase